MPIVNGTPGDDTLAGTTDHDLINGLQGNDTIAADEGDDLVRPGTGDDSADGGAGIDRVSYASVGDDIVTGVTVSLALQGTAQNTGGGGTDFLTGFEHLTGTRYNDVLTGDGGDNWIWGGSDTLGNSGNDTISGGGGNDLIEVGAGTLTLDGGSGSDTLWAYGNQTDITSGVTISLALQGAAQDSGQGMWLLNGFENLSGSIFADSLSGDGGDNVLAGDAGNDTLNGGAGADTLYGDGQLGVDSHGLGYSGPITFYTDVSANYDPLLFTFNDVLDGGAGDDIMNGGAGTDTASFASWTEAVNVGLGVGGNGFATNNPGTENDQLISIENVTGSAFNDSINGNNDGNVLDGGAGGDALFGRGGDDTLIGGEGDDFLRGSDGADTLDGGNGWDRVSSFVVAPTAGITFNLNIQGVAQDTGQGMDVLIGIEHASGTVLSDTLIGDSGSNWLWGGADAVAGGGTGDDNINGGDGDDLVEVGSGNHTLAGGLGTDALSFLGGRVEIGSAGVTYSLALQGAAQATEQGSMNTSGFENVSGSLFDDVLTGDGGANILAGDFGSDNLSGGDGDDTLYGDGRIWVDISGGVGGSGPIATFGQLEDEPGLNEGDPDLTSGDDTLNGGKGDDDLYGGRGNDIMTGGQNSDRFIIEGDSGDDVITDFKSVDSILFDAASGVDDFSDLVLTAAPGNSTLISWGTDDSILVQGVKPTQLGASDFEFEAAASASVVKSDARGSSFGSGDDGNMSGLIETMLQMNAMLDA